MRKKILLNTGRKKLFFVAILLILISSVAINYAPKNSKVGVQQDSNYTDDPITQVAEDELAQNNNSNLGGGNSDPLLTDDSGRDNDKNLESGSNGDSSGTSTNTSSDNTSVNITENKTPSPTLAVLNSPTPSNIPTPTPTLVPASPTLTPTQIPQNPGFAVTPSGLNTIYIGSRDRIENVFRVSYEGAESVEMSYWLWYGGFVFSPRSFALTPGSSVNIALQTYGAPSGVTNGTATFRNPVNGVEVAVNLHIIVD